jgi:hypothetical protein
MCPINNQNGDRVLSLPKKTTFGIITLRQLRRRAVTLAGVWRAVEGAEQARHPNARQTGHFGASQKISQSGRLRGSGDVRGGGHQRLSGGVRVSHSGCPGVQVRVCGCPILGVWVSKSGCAEV